MKQLFILTTLFLMAPQYSFAGKDADVCRSKVIRKYSSYSAAERQSYHIDQAIAAEQLECVENEGFAKDDSEYARPMKMDDDTSQVRFHDSQEVEQENY